MLRTRSRIIVLAAAITASLVPALATATSAPALSSPTVPWLTLDRTITSQPWAGSTTKAFDLEGSAYLPFDHTMWVVDDQGDAAFEIDPATGKLLHTISQSAFAAAPPP